MLTKTKKLKNKSEKLLLRFILLWLEYKELQDKSVENMFSLEQDIKKYIS